MQFKTSEQYLRRNMHIETVMKFWKCYSDKETGPEGLGYIIVPPSWNQNIVSLSNVQKKYKVTNDSF